MPPREEPAARLRARTLWFLAVGMATLTFALYAGDLVSVGVTWDEPAYFESVERIQRWAATVPSSPAQALRQDEVHAVWDAAHYFNPHPPLYKVAMAVTDGLAGGRVHPVLGYRLAPLGFFALLAGALAWFAGRWWGPVAAVVAPLALLLSPRLAGHAHLGATETPLAALWFISTAGLAWAVHTRRR